MQSTAGATHQEKEWYQRAPAACGVRDLQSGRLYIGRTKEASQLEVWDLHPVLARRMRVQRAALLRLRELREGEGGRTTGEALLQRLQSDSAWAADAVSEGQLLTLEGTATALEQLTRLASLVVRLERAIGRGMTGMDWQQLHAGIGRHSPVEAVNMALFARNAAGEEDLKHLELQLQSSIGEAVTARCVHCAYITHGVKPSAKQLVTELALGGYLAW